MMSKRDALRSYRRQYRRVFGIGKAGTDRGVTPEFRELCRRGDMLQRLTCVFCVDRTDNSQYPAHGPRESIDAYCWRDLRAIEDDGCCR